MVKPFWTTRRDKQSPASGYSLTSTVSAARKPKLKTGKVVIDSPRWFVKYIQIWLNSADDLKHLETTGQEKYSKKQLRKHITNKSNKLEYHIPSGAYDVPLHHTWLNVIICHHRSRESANIGPTRFPQIPEVAGTGPSWDSPRVAGHVCDPRWSGHL